jgi:tRNA threonylcarbamoyl adenosine modification protein YeaZ
VFDAMNVLALDTASPLPAVAVATERGDWEERLPLDRRASEELLAAIGRVLEAAGTELSSCRRIAACSGPGSFTGTRVGLATAWGLGRALGIPVEPVPTLEAIADSARAPGIAQVLTALDAGRGEVLVQVFSIGEERAQPISAAQRLSLAQAAARLATVPFAVSLPEDLLGLPGRLRESPARAMARAVARAPREPSDPRALYTRASAAEEKRGAP